MNGRTPLDRREFLRDAAALAALGGAYAFGGAGEALARVGGLSGHLLEAPPPGAARPFHMLVLGDSIAWGQALDEESKFSTKIQRWLEARLGGRSVQRYVFAHSGAHIAPNEAGDAQPPLPGEVPHDWPSITAQVSLARDHLGKVLVDASPPKGARTPTALRRGIPVDQVDLVLLDGGINDVKTTTILTMDPTISDKVGWVRHWTRERVGPRMERLLSLVLTAFPNARVVVTGYYPIISASTDFDELLGLLKHWRLIPDTDLVNDPFDTLTETLIPQLSAQSMAFHEESLAGLRQAVRDARAMEVIASAASASAPRKRAPNRLDPRSVRAAPVRAVFAHVPFGPQHSYAGPESYLYRLWDADPVAAERREQCEAAGRTGTVEREWCIRTHAAHPNRRGAQAYADSIARELERFLPLWGGTQPPVPRRPERKLEIPAQHPFG